MLRPVWLLLWATPLLAHRPFGVTSVLRMRGGDDETLTLDQKVQAAMRKLGLKPPEMPVEEEKKEAQECEGGICPMPNPPAVAPVVVDLPEEPTETTGVPEAEMNVHQVAKDMAQEMGVDPSLAMAALGATAQSPEDSGRVYFPDQARAMIQQELDMIEQVPADAPTVQTLVDEGFDPFLSRRALAFTDLNLEDARALLIAEQEDDEEEEEIVPAPAPKTEPFRTVAVDTNFDPTKVETPAAAPAPPQAPKPARKEDVVFEATTAQIQELVLESPVPVLLDIYADWCGPCKALGPALEEMAIKMGGAFRLVKVNSDSERPVSQALQVSALPTVFGIRDGKILNMFQGMPRSDDMIKNFMMGLIIPGQAFKPPVSAEDKAKYAALTTQLHKTAGAAAFPFSARERLQDKVSTQLDALVGQAGGVLEAEDSAKVIRSLLSNIIKDPFDPKFRSVNLANKVIGAKVGKYPAARAILKACGFGLSGDDRMVFGGGKAIVNVAPLSIARDSIEKWTSQKRYELAKAARARKDEEERAKLDLSSLEEEEEEEEEEAEVDPNACALKVRVDGKKKIHELDMHIDDPLSSVLERLSIISDQEAHLTCVAKKLVVKSTDAEAMAKSLKDHGLAPSAMLVVRIAREKEGESGPSLAERASASKKLSRGSHTMQSVGIYAKDDNNKAELIDGGGGVWYEHDVSEDEEDAEETIEESAATEEDVEEEEDVKEDSPEEEEADEDEA